MRIVNLVESQPRRRGWWVGVNRAGVGHDKHDGGASGVYPVSYIVYALWGAERACVRGDRRARCMSRWQCIR